MLWSPHIKSTWVPRRKSITDIGVTKETKHLLQSSERGARQLLLNTWASWGSRGEGSYRWDWSWEVHDPLMYTFLVGPWGSWHSFDCLGELCFSKNWWWTGGLHLVCRSQEDGNCFMPRPWICQHKSLYDNTSYLLKKTKDSMNLDNLVEPSGSLPSVVNCFRQRAG